MKTKRKKSNIGFALTFILAFGITAVLLGIIWHFESRIKNLKSTLVEDTVQQKGDLPPEPKPEPQAAQVSSAPRTDAVAAVAAPMQKAPRHLSEEQKNNLQSGLKDIADDISGANIYMQSADADSQPYAKEFAAVFANAGIKTIAAGAGSATSGKSHGLLIKVSNKDMPSKEAQLLFQALRNAGFEASFANWADEDIDNKSVKLVVSAR